MHYMYLKAYFLCSVLVLMLASILGTALNQVGMYFCRRGATHAANQWWTAEAYCFRIVRIVVVILLGVSVLLVLTIGDTNAL